MNNFKKGDWVTRIIDGYGTDDFRVEVGETYRVNGLHDNNHSIELEGREPFARYAAEYFRLATQAEVNKLQFDMKSESWMVYADRDTCYDVYDWIMTQGFNFAYPSTAFDGIRSSFDNGAKDIAFLKSKDYGSILLYTEMPEQYEDTHYVIKVNPVKYVTYEVEYPKILTPKEKEIERLMSAKAKIEAKLAKLQSED